MCVSFLMTSAAMLIAINAPIPPPILRNGQLPGSTVTPILPHSMGLVVTSLQSQGAAERAGIQVGDDVVAIDYHQIASLGQARDLIQHDPNATIQLRLLHNHPFNDVSLTRSEDHANGT